MTESQPGPSGMNNQINDSEITWKHPSHIFQRLVALLLMCLIGFGNQF